MLLRIPDFYDSFHCIGGKCPDNCCIGWELDIDDDTYEYYRSVKGPFGERLRANMSGAEKSSESESVSFRLQVDGRCPFLNAENLCDICLELGPDALCRICTDYPRYSFEWGDAIEKSLTLSCPEAGRLLFLNDIPVRFKEIPLNESGLDAYMTDEKYEEMSYTPMTDEDKSASKIMTTDDSAPKENDNTENDVTFIEEYDEEDPEQVKKIEHIRTECIRILQDRTLSIADRITKFLQVCDTPDFSPSPESRLEILSGTEILNARWSTILHALEAFISDKETYR